MTRALRQAVVVAAVVCLTAVGSLAQQSTTSSSSETKAFEVLAVEGNTLVVRLPEGTRELTVPDDYRFTINGQQMGVRELKVGMKGTATITTRTTVTPVTVTEVRNATVVVRSGSTVIVRMADNEVRSFSQGEVDKRGVKIYSNGKPVQLSELHEGNRLSATIVTSRPPRVVTEKEVQATLAAAAPAAAAPPAAPRAAAAPPAATGAAAAPPAAPRAAAAPAAAAPPAATRAAAAPAAQPEATTAARTLPKTASSWPLLGLASAVLLAMALTLTVRRRLVR